MACNHEYDTCNVTQIVYCKHCVRGLTADDEIRMAQELLTDYIKNGRAFLLIDAGRHFQNAGNLLYGRTL